MKVIRVPVIVPTCGRMGENSFSLGIAMVMHPDAESIRFGTTLAA